MSIYHFNIEAALGWFSSTTHLSTLAVLRTYFIEHPRLRNWRVVAMLSVLVLLITARVVTLASTLDHSLPVRYAFSHGSSRDQVFCLLYNGDHDLPRYDSLQQDSTTVLTRPRVVTPSLAVQRWHLAGFKKMDTIK